MKHKCRCAYVPPHVSGRILRSADSMLKIDPEKIEMLRQSELKTQSFRSHRSDVPVKRVAKPEAVPTSAAAAMAQNGDRIVYNCKHQTNQRVELIRSENDSPSNDTDGDTVFDLAGIVKNYFKNILHRNSIDDNNMNIVLNVHYGVGYGNAFWDGDEMTFGDGDGQVFSSFSKSLDVVAHELAHGVTQFTAGLDYYSQSGALNEHFSDVFGTVITQHHLNQTSDTADWLIGNEIMGPTLDGETLRSMKAPGTAYSNGLMGDDPQPAHMRDYYTGAADNQGVHINSGIPNRVFYLVATDQLGTDKAGQLWYETLLRLWPNADFQDYAEVLINTSRRMTGQGVLPEGTTQTVRAALREVGL